MKAIQAGTDEFVPEPHTDGDPWVVGHRSTRKTLTISRVTGTGK